MSKAPCLTDAERAELLAHMDPQFRLGHAAARQEAMEEICALRRQRDEARKALDRLGSMKTFTISTVIDKNAMGDELLARIDFARAALEKNSETANTQLPDWPRETNPAMSISWIEKDPT